nr:unnamed protein product [Callosobruchus analis]
MKIKVSSAFAATTDQAVFIVLYNRSKMPRSKQNIKRPVLDTKIMENAVNLVKAKKFTLHGASVHFRISRTTLRRYYRHMMKEGTAVQDLHENLAVKKVFNEEQEKMLVVYIKDAANLQFGLTLKDVKVLAYQFAKANQMKYPTSWDSAQMAGEYWLRLYRKRYKEELSLRKPEATSLARSSAFNKYSVELTFNNYKKALSQCPSDLQAVNIWNIDETGLSTMHVPPKILAPTGVKQVGSMASAERGNTVTMIAASNAGGGFIPPMLIFPRVNFKDFMIHGAPEGTLGAATPTGWSNEALFVMFMKHFIKFARTSKERPVINFMDNHESHISVPAIRLAKENGVILVTLHPHTSNKMQPLDKSVFGPFKTYFNQAANEKMLTPGHIGKPLTIYDIAELTDNSLVEEPPAQVDPYLPQECVQSDKQSTQQFSQGPSEQAEMHLNFSKTPQKVGPSSSKLITPEIIRPHPKAAPRKGTQKGKRKGKSRILTDTPEKNAIEALKKVNLKENHKLKKRKNNEKKKTDRVKRKILIESDSEDSNYSVHDTDDTCDENESSDSPIEENNDSYEIGDFVIFVYEDEYFVGKIESLSEEGVLIKSMQKSLKNWKWPDKDDLNLYPYQDIKRKINPPKRINSNTGVYQVFARIVWWTSVKIFAAGLVVKKVKLEAGQEVITIELQGVEDGMGAASVSAGVAATASSSASEPSPTTPSTIGLQGSPEPAPPATSTAAPPSTVAQPQQQQAPPIQQRPAPSQSPPNTMTGTVCFSVLATVHARLNERCACDVIARRHRFRLTNEETTDDTMTETSVICDETQN